MVELMRGATAESVRLAAARSIVSVGMHPGDSLTFGVRRQLIVSERDHKLVIDGLMKIVLRLLPGELHDRLWIEIDAWVKAQSA